MIGSGWAEYKKKGTICDIPLPAGLQESEQLEKPLFTPSTKAEIGDHGKRGFIVLICQCLSFLIQPVLQTRTFTLANVSVWRGASQERSKCWKIEFVGSVVDAIIGERYAKEVAEVAVRVYKEVNTNPLDLVLLSKC